MKTQPFYHPDYTVGPGIPPDHALEMLAGYTAGREWLTINGHAPCPEGVQF